MKRTLACTRCGAKLLDTMLDGLCPRCLAAAAFGDPAESGTQVGNYDLLSEIGRGGMGVVHLARQRNLDRLVAVKVLLTGAQGGEEAGQRLVREAREASRLRHPHIVAIHEVGQHEGLPFYSMDLIEGEDLAAYAASKRPGTRECAALVAKAARAVQHAHDSGILHRDLKPANLLIDDRGEPHLTDFGLVAPIGGASGLTRAGEVLGSPGYMAPEQLRGAAGVSSDVYGLGAVLYFLLTGRPPFVAAQLPELLAAVERGDPVPPRRLDPSLPRDLETIGLRALAREPASRYATAGALADDLERWTAGRPIRARPVSLVERAWRWSNRNRLLASVAALLACAVMGGAAGILWQWRRAEHAAASTTAHLYSADLKMASDALLTGDLGTARHALESCPVNLRDAAWGLLWPQTTGDAEAVLGSASWTVTHLAVSPDGALAASAAQVDTVRLWDLVADRLIGELPGTEMSWWVEFSPDGRQLFTADRTVKQWEVASRTLLREFPGQSGVLSPDGKILYTCAGHRFVFEGSAGSVVAWNVADGAKLFELAGPARTLALSSDGQKLAVSDAESSIAVFDALDGRALIGAWPSLDRLWHLVFSPDGRLLVASGWSRSVRVWDLADVSAGPRRLVHPLNTWETAFSPDTRTLAVACSDRTVHVWDTQSWNELRAWRGHDHEVWSVAWQPDGRLLSAGRDPRILRWPQDVHRSEPWLRHDPNSFNIVWLPGDRLATARDLPDGSSRAVIASVLASGEEEQFPGEIPLAFDAQSNRLWLWSHTGELRARLVSHLSDVIGVPWSRAASAAMVDIPRVEPRARVAWAVMQDGALDVRRLSDGSRVARHEKVISHRPLVAAAISPDGRWFVWGGASAELFVLDLVDGRRERLEGHRYEVASVVFTPDGKSFVTGGVDGLIFAWDTAAPHARRQLGRHPTSAGQLAFSPDGRVLASHEVGLGVHLWHPATSREVGFLRLPDEGAGQHWIGFSPEGGWLALRRTDGEVRVVPVAAESIRLP